MKISIKASTEGSKSRELLETLKSHGIDTTKCQYELTAEEYERYHPGEVYTIKFSCPGDYLAYFSMWMHERPSIARFEAAYGDDLILEMEDCLNRFPTVEALAEHAAANWWGDGDDYIISLKNLTTGELLYRGEYEYPEAEDDDEYDWDEEV